MLWEFWALKKSGTKLLDTNKPRKHFTRSDEVCKSERRDRDGKVIDSVSHYTDVDYIKMITTKTYANIFVCKYFGAESEIEFKKNIK